MSYHAYTTSGMVLKGIPTGEADKYFYILTEQLGLIVATARSVRKGESKLARGLEDFCFGTFTFIKGKHSWKVTGVDPKENMYRSIPYKESKIALVNILLLIRRLVRGESLHRELFSIAKSLFIVLSTQRYSQNRLFAIESLATLRLLFQLGYVHADGLYKDILCRQSYSEEDIQYVLDRKKEMLADINTALTESQL